MDKKKVLIVEDERTIRKILSRILNEAGYKPIEATNGNDALVKISSDTDLVLLDVMLPGMSGYEICRTIRNFSNVPVLFLTAKTDESDIVHGLSVGGDDYLKKPFSGKELLARVDSVIRRAKVYNAPVEETDWLVCGIIKLRRDRNEVLLGNHFVSLTATEYSILKLLMENSGEILSPYEIYEKVWHEPFLFSSGNTVMVHIRGLRKKIEKDPQHPQILRTIYGRGYQFCTPLADSKS